MDRKELFFTILLILIGCAGFIYSISLPAMGPIALSPGLFPGIVTALIVLLSGVHLASSLKGKGIQKSEGEYEQKRSLLIIVAFFLVYLLLLHYAHFIISTILFLFLTMFYLYGRFHWKIPIISVSMVLLIYYLFRYLLHVRLP
jgi:xanthine/uracil permease